MNDACNYVTINSYDAPIHTLFKFIKNNRTKKGCGRNAIGTFGTTSFVDNILHNTGPSISKECCRKSKDAQAQIQVIF